ncbi:hypothetical protein GCM10017673_34120 [Streptosporangium violaceochromogenes]|nr:hypothetical protein GCM10017673_34120 [Streptosporangium violaceochromogenes]
MNDTPEQPGPESPDHGRARHPEPQAWPGQGYPPPAPPYDQGGHGHPGAYQGGYPGGHQGSHPPPGYGYGPAGHGYPGPAGMYGPRPGSDDATMAMLAHLLGLLTSFIGPLVLYLAKKDESPYVRAQAAEALNFQLTLMIAYIVSWVLAFVLIGILLVLVIWVGSTILMIIAAVAANRGEAYRYPMNIRFVS